MPTSVRLDAKTEGLVRSLARKTGRTKSQLIRDAIERLARSEAAGEMRETPYETIKHLIGCAGGGPRHLSERSGEKFRELLQARQRR